MPTTPAQILTALRTRLTAAGFTVFIGKVIDPAQDTLPVVSLHFMADGDQTESLRPKPRRSIEIVAEYWCATATDDPLLELLPLGDALEAALIVPDDEGHDRLGGLTIAVEHIRTVNTANEDYSTTGRSQVAIRVGYIRG